MSFFKKNHKSTSYNNVIEDYKLENIIHRKVSDELWLHPYDAERYSTWGKLDAKILTLGSDDEEIQKFLPGLSTSEEALEKKMLSVELGLGISYLITGRNFSVGMIDLTTPKSNKIRYNMDMWTLDYFIINKLRNTGIMSSCFPSLLKLMTQNLGIEEIYAWVHEDNTRSIHVLEKFFFRVVDSIPLHDDTRAPIISPHYLAWKCPLRELRFFDRRIECPAYWADRPTYWEI